MFNTKNKGFGFGAMPGFNGRKVGTISNGDFDRDGVKNKGDCDAFNFKKQGDVHEFAAKNYYGKKYSQLTNEEKEWIQSHITSMKTQMEKFG